MPQLDLAKVNNYSSQIKDNQFTCFFCEKRRNYQQDLGFTANEQGKELLCCWLCWKLGDGQDWQIVSKVI